MLNSAEGYSHASFYQSAEHINRAAYPMVNAPKDTKDQGSEYQACSFIALSLPCSLTFFLMPCAPPSASLFADKIFTESDSRWGLQELQANARPAAPGSNLH